MVFTFFAIEVDDQNLGIYIGQYCIIISHRAWALAGNYHTFCSIYVIAI